MGRKNENATLGAVCNANGLWQWVVRCGGRQYRSHREFMKERAALAAGRKMLRKLAKLRS